MAIRVKSDHRVKPGHWGNPVNREPPAQLVCGVSLVRQDRRDRRESGERRGQLDRQVRVDRVELTVNPSRWLSGRA